MGQSSIYRHFLIEGDPLLSRAKAVQETHDKARLAAVEFARKHGAPGYYTSAEGLFGNHRPVRVVGLMLADPVPSGWKVSGRGKHRMMVPRADAAEVSAEMAALPEFPNLRAVANEMLGWDPNLSWDDAESKGGMGLPSAQLIWTNSSFCLALPLGRLFGPGDERSIRNAMAHPVPEGCREITEAEWALIDAQARVDRERSAA